MLCTTYLPMSSKSVACLHDALPIFDLQVKEGERQAALKRGPHRSATEHTLFLREEFDSMIEKGQWVVLPY